MTQDNNKEQTKINEPLNKPTNGPLVSKTLELKVESMERNPSSQNLNQTSNINQEKNAQKSEYLNLFQNIADKNSEKYPLSEYLQFYENIYATLQYYLHLENEKIKTAVQKKDEISALNNDSAINIKKHDRNIRGKILISIEPANELLNFFSAVVKSEDLECEEFDLMKIIEQPSQLLYKLNLIFENYINSNDQPQDKLRILIIPIDKYEKLIQNISHQIISGERFYSSELFQHHLFESISKLNPLEHKKIIIVIKTHNFYLPIEQYSEFDIIYTIEKPNLTARKKFVEQIIENYTKAEIDFEHIAMYMEGWNIGEIRQFLKFAMFQYEVYKNKERKDVLEFNQKYLMDFLEQHQKLDSKYEPENKKLQSSITLTENNKIKNLDLLTTINQDLDHQLYQDLASNHYEDMSIILDKLIKGLVLQPFERQILAESSFVLRDDPQKALQKLNKAKLAVDRITGLKIKEQKPK